MQELTKDEILTQLLLNNYVEKEFTLGNKLKLKLRTISTKDQLEIENELSKLQETSQVYILHVYGLHLLARSVITYGEKSFTTEKWQDTFKFLETLPTSIVDILIKLRDDFHKEVLQLTVPEELEKHFFPVSSSGEESS